MVLLPEVAYPEPKYAKKSQLSTAVLITRVVEALEPTRKVVSAVTSVSRQVCCKAQEAPHWYGLTKVSRSGEYIFVHTSRRLQHNSKTGWTESRYRFSVELESGRATDATMDALQERLREAPGIERLSLMDSDDVSTEGFEGVTDVATLQSITIHRCEEIHSISHLATYARALQVIDLSEVAIPINGRYTGFDGIESLPALRKLSMTFMMNFVCNPSEERDCVQWIGECAALEVLDLSGNDNVTVAVLDAILTTSKGYPSAAALTLRDICVAKCPGLKSVRFLRYVPKLKRLDISQTGVDFLTEVSGALDLEHLSVMDCLSVNQVKELRQLPSLTEVDLSGTPIEPTMEFHPMAKLADLRISRCNRIHNLDFVTKCSWLRRFTAAAISISGIDLAELGRLAAVGGSLEEVDVNCCPNFESLSPLITRIDEITAQEEKRRQGGSQVMVEAKTNRSPLRTLIANGCMKLDTTGLQGLKGSTTVQLERLDISRTSVTSLKPLYGQHLVEVLQMSGCNMEAEELTDFAKHHRANVQSGVAAPLKRLELHVQRHQSFASIDRRHVVALFAQPGLIVEWEKRWNSFSIPR